MIFLTLSTGLNDGIALSKSFPVLVTMLFLQATISNLIFPVVLLVISSLQRRNEASISVCDGRGRWWDLCHADRAGRGGGCLEFSDGHFRPGPVDGVFLFRPQVSSIPALIGTDHRK
jgi:hypothetical protein